MLIMRSDQHARARALPFASLRPAGGRARDDARVCREIYLNDNALTTLPGEIFKTNTALTYAPRPRPALCVPAPGGGDVRVTPRVSAGR